GGTGDETVQLQDAITVSASIDGGGGTNTLIGPDADNAWLLTGNGAGSVVNVSFTGVQNLTGGAEKDNFQVAAQGGLSGVIDGAGGENTITVQGTSGDDQFFLTGVGSGQTQFGTTNNTVPGFTIANAGLTALNLDTGAGHDSLTGNSLEASFSPEVTIASGDNSVLTLGTDTVALHGSIHTSGLTVTAPDAITVDGSIQTSGGELSLSAETIAIAGSPGARIALDTRDLDAGGVTAGDSGDITLEGRDISISHAELRADVDNGGALGPGGDFEAGAIEVTTDDSAIRQSTYFSPVFAASKDASVDVEDSSIHGGDVTISATAEDQNLYDDLGEYVDQLVGNGFGLLGQVPGILTSLISGIAAQVDVRLSTATID